MDDQGPDFVPHVNPFFKGLVVLLFIAAIVFILVLLAVAVLT